MTAPPELPDHLTLYFDGACEPNPGGWGVYGWALLAADGQVFAHGHGVAMRPGPDSTNNVAEYVALGKGLRHLSDRGWRGELDVRGDSQLVIKQLGGDWACNKPALVKLRDRCADLLAGVATLAVLTWVPRDDNVFCDGLARLAYEEATGKPFPERVRKKKP